MADSSALARALGELLSKCAHTPAASSNQRDFTPKLLSGAAVPTALKYFLSESTSHPQYVEQAYSVMSATMEDFGVRLYRHFLAIGLKQAAKRSKIDNDLDQNKNDLLFLELLLTDLMVECINTPFVPENVPTLLGRCVNALGDARKNNSKSALFALPERPQHRFGSTAGTIAAGRLAAALEIAVAGGMKLRDAKNWLAAEIRKAGLVDEIGNSISAERVAHWRGNFRKEIGAKNARQWFNMELQDHRALISTPRTEQKLAACLEWARKLIQLLAKTSNRTIPPPKTS